MANESAEFCYKPDVNYDEAIMEQQRNIEKEITDSKSLIGHQEDFASLEKEYGEDQVYLRKLQDLKGKYKCIRKVRGDGNCFFRGFGFAYMEQLLKDKEEYTRFKEIAAKSKDVLVSLGFPQFTIEDFHDTFMEVVEKIGNNCPLEELLGIYNDQGYSDYLVVYLRLLVSGHLQKEHEFFQHFVEGGRTVKEFCNQEVEPMGKESDHIHITALTSSTQVPVKVEYMDRAGSGTNSHEFPDGSQPKLVLLYRPGHYDVLYQ